MDDDATSNWLENRKCVTNGNQSKFSIWIPIPFTDTFHLHAADWLHNAVILAIQCHVINEMSVESRAEWKTCCAIVRQMNGFAMSHPGSILTRRTSNYSPNAIKKTLNIWFLRTLNLYSFTIFCLHISIFIFITSILLIYRLISLKSERSPHREPRSHNASYTHSCVWRVRDRKIAQISTADIISDHH